jgi:DNA modification methylase
VTAYYDDGQSVIHHGDALELLPALAAGSAHMVCTDPPYVIGAVSSGALGSKSGGWQDMMNSAGWFTAWYREADRILKRTGSFWSFLNWRTLPVVMRAAVDAGLPVTSLAVWDKEWIGPGGTQGLRPSYELVALMAQPDFAVPDRGTADVLRHKVGSWKPNGHPAEKPVPIVRRLMEIADVPAGGLVVDPFMGSGTAAIAARDRGLRFVGIEAEERWCEVAALRLSQGDLFGELTA